MAPGRRKSSDVWEHFSQPNKKNEVVCNYCKITLVYCKSTGSLRKHLRSKHFFVQLDKRSSDVIETTVEVDNPATSSR